MLILTDVSHFDSKLLGLYKNTGISNLKRARFTEETQSKISIPRARSALQKPWGEVQIILSEFEYLNDKVQRQVIPAF